MSDVSESEGLFLGVGVLIDVEIISDVFGGWVGGIYVGESIEICWVGSRWVEITRTWIFSSCEYDCFIQSLHMSFILMNNYTSNGHLSSPNQYTYTAHTVTKQNKLSSMYDSWATLSVSTSQKFLHPACTPWPFWLPRTTWTIYLYLSLPSSFSLYLTLSAIYRLRGLRSLGGLFCLGSTFSLKIFLMIYLASEGLNFSRCLGLIWY